MDGIEKQVSGLRGLCPSSGIPRNLLSKDQLRQKVENDFFKDYSRQDAADDVVTLAALGLLTPGFNLYDLYINLYSEQVAGYYDDTDKKMYVIQQADFGGLERMTYAHEYTHTLQDQNYDLRGKLHIEDEYCQKHNQYCSAASALVEGDATMLEQEWFSTYGSKTDQQQVLDFSLTFKSPVLDSAPEFLKMDFMFPYQAGFEFVRTVYDRGGWQAVDAAYKNPPVSTEQILHPETYPSVTPVLVDIPDLAPALDAGWEKLDRDELGEWYVFLVLAYGDDTAARLPVETARKAARGWAGDLYATDGNRKSGASVFVYRSVWDTSAEADEFWDALTKYGTSRWGNPSQAGMDNNTWVNAGGVVSFKRNGKEILWVSAPDKKTILSIQVMIPGF
jgi:hypothetical protein